MKNALAKVTTDYLTLTASVLLASFGLKAFLIPNGFLDGGITGISMLINVLTGHSIALVFMVLSLPFIVIAYFYISRETAFKSLYSILLLAICIHYENFGILTDDKILIAVFGGFFLGLGIGFAVRVGGVLDGAEIIALFLYRRFGVSISTFILGFNTILFLITSVSLGIEMALYSILTFIITARTTDVVIRGVDTFYDLTIISKQSEQLQQALLEVTGSGLTVLEGARGYGQSGHSSDLKIIQIVVNQLDLHRTYRVIDNIDPKAFTVEHKVTSMRGGVTSRWITSAALYSKLQKQRL